MTPGQVEARLASISSFCFRSSGVDVFGSGLRLLVLASLVVAASLGLSSSAVAAPQGPWEFSVASLSAPGQDAHGGQVAIAPDGTTTAIWVRYDGQNNVIQAATRPPAGAFGAPVNLSEPGQSALQPRIAVAPEDGTATVVWERDNGKNDVIQAATRSPGGTFGAPVNLSDQSEDATDPEVSVASDGTATVVWSRYDGKNNVIQAATRPPAGVFGKPVTISASGNDAQDPEIAVAANGAAVAVWPRFDGKSSVVQAASRPPGGAFGVAENISVTGQSAYSPMVALAPDGAATVVWRRFDGSNWIVQTTNKPPNGVFAAPINLSVTGHNAGGPQITVARDGTATAGWYLYEVDKDIVQATTRPPNGAFGAVVDISSPDLNCHSVRFAIAPDGTTTAVWQHDDGLTDVIQAATRPPGGKFRTPEDLSAPVGSAQNAELAISAEGRVTVVWSRDNLQNNFIQSISTALPDYVLKVSAKGEGTVSSVPQGISCGAVCEKAFRSHTKVSLTAVAATGSSFAGWSGACASAGSSPVCLVEMKDETDVGAMFVKPTDPEKPIVDPPPTVNPTEIFAVFDGKDLRVRLMCPKRFRPACVSRAVPVTKKGYKRVRKHGKKVRVLRGKAMASVKKVRVRSNKWVDVTFRVKPAYRSTVLAMSKVDRKQLVVRQQIRSKKLFGKANRRNSTIFHTYKVRPLG